MNTRQRVIAHVRQPRGLLQVIGTLACLAVFVAHVQERPVATAETTALTIGNQALPGRLLGWLVQDPSVFAHTAVVAAFFLCFAAALLAVTWSRHCTARTRATLVSVQMLIGILVNNDLLLVLAAQLPIVYRPRPALLWLAGQTLGMGLVWGFVALTWDETNTAAGLPEALASATDARLHVAGTIATSLLLFIAWQVFAFCLGYVAMSERVNRDRLTAANAQLRAAQQLLAGSARSGERLRIARELHDGLGHHLTALGLHLDLAERQTGHARAASITTARAVVRDLLSEVRGAVGREREEDPTDLEQSLRTMCAGIPGMQVALEYGPGCAFSDHAQAHAVFRGVQEAISNALRHADTDRMRVSLRQADGGVRVEIRDYGRGSGAITPGNGLQGMRERIEACGGLMQLSSAPGTGVSLAFHLPARRGAA